MITWTDSPTNSVPLLREALIEPNQVPAALRSLADMLEADDFLDLVSLTLACDTDTMGFRVEAVLTDSYAAQEAWEVGGR